jgi:predicted Zn-dependent protease
VGEGGADPGARGASDEDRASRPAQARPSASTTRERPKDPEAPAAEAPAAEAQAPEEPHKLDALMAEANKTYDRGDLDEAKAIAQKVLAQTPNNVRMLRIVVSASCISGDNAEAQKAYLLLPKPDREQMKTRCARYGVTFTD